MRFNGGAQADFAAFAMGTQGNTLHEYLHGAGGLRDVLKMRGSAMRDVCSMLLRLAINQALANARLSQACLALKPGEWEAARPSFFPSLKLTMSHLLNADRYYADTISPGCLDALPDSAGETVSGFVSERVGTDRWFVGFCRTLTPARADSMVTVRWPEKSFDESLSNVLLHVFLHGQHHRGQIHAMLSGTSVAPPQIDEFILRADADLRTSDMEAFGWTEADFLL